MKVNKSKQVQISLLLYFVIKSFFLNVPILYPLKTLSFIFSGDTKWEHGGKKWIKKHSISLGLKKLCEANLKRNERTSKEDNFSTKTLLPASNKWITALPRFLCFRKLSDYNLKWETLSKIQFTEKEKATLSIVTERVFL